MAGQRVVPRPDGTERWSYLGGQEDADRIFSIPRPLYESGGAALSQQPATLTSFGTTRSLHQPQMRAAVGTSAIGAAPLAPGSKSIDDLHRENRGSRTAGYFDFLDDEESCTSSPGAKREDLSPKKTPFVLLPRVTASPVSHDPANNLHSRQRNSNLPPLAYSLANEGIQVTDATESASDSGGWLARGDKKKEFREKCYRAAGMFSGALEATLGALLIAYCVYRVINVAAEDKSTSNATPNILSQPLTSANPNSNTNSTSLALHAALSTGHCGLVLFVVGVYVLLSYLVEGMALGVIVLTPGALVAVSSLVKAWDCPLALGYEAVVDVVDELMQQRHMDDFWLRLSLLIVAVLLVLACRTICTILACGNLVSTVQESITSLKGGRLRKIARMATRVMAMFGLFASTAALGTTMVALVNVAQEAPDGTTSRAWTLRRQFVIPMSTCTPVCTSWVLLLLSSLGKRSSKALRLAAVILGCVPIYALLQSAPEMTELMILTSRGATGSTDDVVYIVLASLNVILTFFFLIIVPLLACTLI